MVKVKSLSFFPHMSKNLSVLNSNAINMVLIFRQIAENSPFAYVLTLVLYPVDAVHDTTTALQDTYNDEFTIF
jgi:hypothetical protein